MTHYYVPGNGEITNEKAKRKLPKVKLDCGILLLMVVNIWLNQLIITHNTQLIINHNLLK